MHTAHRWRKKNDTGVSGYVTLRSHKGGDNAKPPAEHDEREPPTRGSRSSAYTLKRKQGEEMNCGTKDHEEDCLCDVHVDAPIAIFPLDPKTFWGLKVAMDSGHTLDDTESILDVLEALCKAKDMMQFVNLISNSGKPMRVNNDLRVATRNLIRQGHSMTDMPNLLHESWSKIMFSLTNGVGSMVWTWPKEMWGAVEDYLYTQETWPGYRAIMRRFDIERGPATVVERLYRDICSETNHSNYMRARQFVLDVPTRRLHYHMKYLEREGITMQRFEMQAIRTRVRAVGAIPRRTEKMADFRARTRDTGEDDEVN